MISYLILFFCKKQENTAWMGFYLLFFCFFFSTLFCPHRVKVAQLAVGIFFFPFCLLPLQCCFLLGGCYLLFFLLMFLPYSCFNNVKSQVLACSSWLLPICFSCSVFLAAVLSVFLSLVFRYLMSVDAKLSISSRLRERILERKQVQQRDQKLSYQCMYYYFCTDTLYFPATFLYYPLFVAVILVLLLLF